MTEVAEGEEFLVTSADVITEPQPIKITTTGPLIVANYSDTPYRLWSPRKLEAAVRLVDDPARIRIINVQAYEAGTPLLRFDYNYLVELVDIALLSASRQEKELQGTIQAVVVDVPQILGLVFLVASPWQAYIAIERGNVFNSFEPLLPIRPRFK